MKKSKVFLFLFIISIIFVGCNSGNTKDGQKTTPESDNKIEQKEENGLTILESGYSVDDGKYMTFCFVVENEDSEAAYELYTVTITAYDEKGAVLATTDQVMNSIEPGEKQSFSSIMDCNGENPSDVKFTIDFGNKKKPSNSSIKSSDLEISGTNDRKGDYNDVSVTGMVKNNSEIDTTSIGVTVLFKKDGNIVYGSMTYIDNLNANEEKPFEITAYNVPDYDSYEVSAHDWGF